MSSLHSSKKKEIDLNINEVESLIEKNETSLNILNGFRKLKGLIDEVEEEEELHGYFKYLYHFKLSCYYNSIGNKNEANKNLDISKRYMKYAEYMKGSPSSATIKNRSDDETKDFEIYNNETEIEKITDEQLRVYFEEFFKEASHIKTDSEFLFEENNLNFFKASIESFIQFKWYNFDDYLRMNAMKETLESLFNEVDLALTEFTKQNDKAIKIQKIVKNCTFLKEYLFQIALVKFRINFMKITLSSSNPIKIICICDLDDYESIKKQFKRLLLHFHPDKMDWLPKIYLNLANEFFMFLSELRDKLLKGFSKTTMNENLEKANHYWQIAKDYKRVINGDFEKLEVLDRSEILGLTEEILKEQREESLNRALCHYKSACKQADEFALHTDQVKIRGYISLVLYELKKDPIIPQLYALSALRFVLKQSNLLTEYDLNNAKKIYEKVSGSEKENGQSKHRQPQTDTIIPTDNNSLVPKEGLLSLIIGSSNNHLSSKMSYENRQKIDNSLSDHLNNAMAKLVVKSDRELIKYQTNREEITRAKSQGLRHKVAGMSLISAGAVGGAWTLQAGIASRTALAFGPVAWVGLGIFFIGTGLFAGYSIKKGNEILEEPKIRENLNEYIKNALDYYDENMYNEFLNELSREYTKGKRLINLENLYKSINCELFIESLIKHGFRPDGIAYLLNLIGEVLISGRLNSLKNFSSDDLKNQALKVFEATLDSKLIDEANKLDDRVKKLRLNNMSFLKKNFHFISTSISDFYLSRNYTSIAREHLEDSKSMPFRFRLEEMRNVSRLNKAIVRLFKNRVDEIPFAEKEIIEVRDSLNKNYQFVGRAALRLEAIEDFFWIITGRQTGTLTMMLELKPNQQYEAMKGSIKTEKYLHYLNECLEQVKCAVEKIKILKKKAEYYEKKAKENDIANKIESLKNWKEALTNYDEVLNIEKRDSVASIGHARCLTKLSKYTKAFKFLEKNKDILGDLPEFWLLQSLAFQRNANYEKANIAITQALSISTFEHDQYSKQKRIIERIMNNNLKKKMKNYEKFNTLNSEETWFTQRIQSKSSYNILSIDGGGVRGIIPALWLCEIEKQTKRPISHLFNMMSGTSVGASMACAFSMPNFETFDTDGGIKVTEYSKFEPKYSAFDIFKLLFNESKKIFSNSEKSLLDWFFGTNISTDKYSDSGRNKVFGEYLQYGFLNNVLNDLVVPAVNQNDMTNPTHYFNKYDVLNDSSKNLSLLDVVMASTAAPTFFPIYKIKNSGSYIDGGVHMNNPAMAAYSEAVRYGVPKENIFVLSLGTGSYILDPFNPELCRGQLFWAQNFHKVALSAQECNVDRDMYQILDNKYERWQIYLDEPVALDDCNKLEYLAELANQYIEELYESDDNKMNKLIEHLLKES